MSLRCLQTGYVANGPQEREHQLERGKMLMDLLQNCSHTVLLMHIYHLLPTPPPQLLHSQASPENKLLLVPRQGWFCLVVKHSLGIKWKSLDLYRYQGYSCHRRKTPSTAYCSTLFSSHHFIISGTHSQSGPQNIHYELRLL